MKVAIVGLGKIGATFPMARGIPRSHLAAIMRTQGAQVAALVDPDEKARLAAEALAPGCPTYMNLGDVPAGSIDLVVDARPPYARAELIETAERLGARGVILEKPIAMTLAEAKSIVDASEKSGIVVRVNFHRRFDAAHEELRTHAGGPFIGAVGVYSKGLRNYGSHLIDLLLHWMGPITAVRAFPAEIPETSGDPTIAFDAKFGGGRFASIRSLPGAAFDVFELTLFGTTTRVDLSNGGASRRLAKASPDLIYDGYTHLSEVFRSESAVAGLTELYAAFVAGLNSGLSIGGATPEDALNGMHVIHSIETSMSDGGSWCSIDPYARWSN